MLLFSSVSAVTLSMNSPSAELALSQLEASVMDPIYCLCYQYAENIYDADLDTMKDPDFNLGGALTNPVDGKCDVRTYFIDAAGKYPGDELFLCPADTEVRHLNVPVDNEACLYNLWMCACWANQADGCLCAFTNPNFESVKIMKPTMGTCPNGSSPVTDMTAAGDEEGHALLGFGGLALKCSPNPCQACCKGQGGSCANCKGGSGFGGGGGGRGCGGGGSKGGGVNIN